MTCPYRETRIDMSPPEPIAWDVCSARDSPGVTYACHAENCTCFGPWGAWRAVVGQMVERMEWIDDCDEWQVAWAISTYLRQWIRSDLDAVGWSP